MKAVLTYETMDSTMEQIMSVFPLHKEYLEKFKKENTVLGIGPFKDRKGSMGIFADSETAARFAQHDPFVLEGIAKNVQIREWQD